ncbi:unnamed protein product [Strongylus vulgaris]|uniref:Uncharacterized protein n=1 Tax=Strongylus vulgaris TaxID=40348 RepID=A0A3P7L0L9_STRVU|nr:unnamed protein product [Strongylus vulgaris]
MSRSRNLGRISKATKDLLERRRALRLDPTASHLKRLVANTTCRTALQESSKETFGSSTRKEKPKEVPQDLLDYRVPLTTLLSEDGTRTRDGDHEEFLHQSLLLVNTRVKTGPCFGRPLTSWRTSPRIACGT